MNNMRKLWLPEDDAYLTANYMNKTNEMLAKDTGRTEYDVMMRMRALHLHRRNTIRWTDNDDAFIIRWYQYKPKSWIAKELGVPQHSIAARMIKLRLHRNL